MNQFYTPYTSLLLRTANYNAETRLIHNLVLGHFSRVLGKYTRRIVFDGLVLSIVLSACPELCRLPACEWACSGDAIGYFTNSFSSCDIFRTNLLPNLQKYLNLLRCLSIRKPVQAHILKNKTTCKIDKTNKHHSKVMSIIKLLHPRYVKYSSLIN